MSLYSCAGEGIIYQHDPTKLNTDASDIDQLIRETNNIQVSHQDCLKQRLDVSRH